MQARHDPLYHVLSCPDAITPLLQAHHKGQDPGASTEDDVARKARLRAASQAVLAAVSMASSGATTLLKSVSKRRK